ncbi:MAG: PEP-CTERM sorting domain-containing protein [Thermoguttaceae bacterium]
MNTRTNLIIASAGLLLAIACTTPSAEANLLVNPGFESGPASLTTDTVVLNNPFVTGQWGAENGIIESGPDNGVTPNSGSYMLTEYHNSYQYTSTYQVTNVPYFPGEQATLSAWFNAPAPISGTAEAVVALSCYAGVNSWPTPLAPPVGQALILSAAPLWQQMSPLTITVPVGTNYIVADVGFLNSSLQDANTGVTFPGFVDDASLTITPEPSSLVLLSVGALALLGYAWRRRRQIGRP